jgi:hypothetical protein
MELLVTEITNMSGNNRCVAGWCAAESRMVRPLPNGGNWSQQLISDHDLTTGCTISVTPTGEPHNGEFPHLSEDTRVQMDSITVVAQGFTTWITGDGPVVAHDLHSAFDGYLKLGAPFKGVQQGPHISTGTKCKSLVGINLPVEQIQFRENQFQDKPKKLHVVLAFGAGLLRKKFDMTVASTTLNAIWRESGIDALNAHLPSAGLVHVRVGLARGWDARPDYCTVMLNGILW